MKREEAKAVIAAIVSMRKLATDEMALEVPAIYPKWRDGRDYNAGERVMYDSVLYKVLQGHCSQVDWTPDTTPSLYAKVLIPDSDVVPEWEQPDSTNPYMKGDKVKHNGSEWVSLIDNNVWEPTEANATLWEKV